MISPGRRGCGDATPLWGCAQVLIPYALWKYMGDREVISRHLPLIHQWVEEQIKQSHNLILTDGLGDWCPPVGNESPLRMPVSHSSTLMLFEICDKMEEISLAFSPEKAQSYRTTKEAVKEAFINAFYQTKDHTYGYVGTDGVALSLGVYPEGEQSALLKSLKERMANSGNQMTTAIYGNKYLFPLLLSAGMGKEAFDVFFSTEHPSFCTMQSQGATTLWECIEMEIPELDSTKRLNSLNHPMHGGFLYSLYTHLAGISPKGAGYKAFFFSPTPNCPLQSFSAHITSPYGIIGVKAKKEGNQTCYALQIPENSQAILKIEQAKSIKINQTPVQNGKILSSGSYTILITE